MDAILATLVLGAVIFFGALISVGNERQRKAIDGLREEAQNWAMQDLRLKRGQMAQNVQVQNPIHWLNQAIMKATGQNVQLSLVETHKNGVSAISCHDENAGADLVFSTVPPEQVKKLGKQKRSRLAAMSDRHPLLPLRKGTEVVELTMLNAGVIFDIELPLALKQLLGEETVSDRLFMYILQN